VIDNALLGVLNDALGKCTINEIIAGTCQFKQQLDRMNQQNLAPGNRF
jgi:hypothetical protein